MIVAQSFQGCGQAAKYLLISVSFNTRSRWCSPVASTTLTGLSKVFHWNARFNARRSVRNPRLMPEGESLECFLANCCACWSVNSSRVRRASSDLVSITLSFSTCARNSGSRQRRARKEARLAGGCCKAASNSALILSQFSDVRSMARCQLSIEPGFGHTPFPLHRLRRNIQHLCNILHGEAFKRISTIRLGRASSFPNLYCQGGISAQRGDARACPRLCRRCPFRHP